MTLRTAARRIRNVLRAALPPLPDPVSSRPAAETFAPSPMTPPQTISLRRKKTRYVRPLVCCTASIWYWALPRRGRPPLSPP